MRRLLLALAPLLSLCTPALAPAQDLEKQPWRDWGVVFGQLDEHDETPSGGAPAAATGSITCVAKAALVDGETVTVSDGETGVNVFEFDVAGDGVGGGNVQVDVSTDVTAEQVEQRLTTAMNGVTWNVTASDGGAGIVDLTNDFNTMCGNVAVTETVADAGFVVAGMTGGMGGRAIALTVAGTWYPWRCAYVEAVYGGMTADVSNSTADKLTIPASGAGYYELDIEASFSGSANVTVTCAVFVDGAVTDTFFERKLSASGDVGSAAAGHIEYLTGGQVVTLRCTGDGAAKSMTVHTLGLTVSRVSGP